MNTSAQHHSRSLDRRAIGPTLPGCPSPSAVRDLPLVPGCEQRCTGRAVVALIGWVGVARDCLVVVMAARQRARRGWCAGACGCAGAGRRRRGGRCRLGGPRQAVRMRWLRTARAQASQRVSGVRPRRSAPAAGDVSGGGVVAVSLIVALTRSALVRVSGLVTSPRSGSMPVRKFCPANAAADSRGRGSGPTGRFRWAAGAATSVVGPAGPVRRWRSDTRAIPVARWRPGRRAGRCRRGWPRRSPGRG
jgi:hypothetical protein